MADLDRMSLDDLCALKDGLDALVGAGRVLVKVGFDPIFDLTPGREVYILSGLRMPGLTLGGKTESAPESEHEPAASPLLPAAAEAPAAVIPDAAGAGDDAAPAAPGLEIVAAGLRVAQQAVPSRTVQVRPWTEEEDRHAVEIAALAAYQGRPRNGAVAAIAAQIDRTPAAVAFRLHTVLKERLQKALEANTPQAGPAAAPEPAEVAPTPAAEAIADPVEAFLRGQKQPLGWPRRVDLSIFEDACDGLDVNTIAIRLEVSPKSVRERFEQLTNKRAFGREAVRDALRRICETPTVSP